MIRDLLFVWKIAKLVIKGGIVCELGTDCVNCPGISADGPFPSLKMHPTGGRKARSGV